MAALQYLAQIYMLCQCCHQNESEGGRRKELTPDMLDMQGYWLQKKVMGQCCSFFKSPCAGCLAKVISGCSSEKVKEGASRIGCLDLILQFSAESCFKTSTHMGAEESSPIKNYYKLPGMKCLHYENRDDFASVNEDND